MAKIKTLKSAGKVFYPTTIPSAVVNPDTKEVLSDILSLLAETVYGGSNSASEALSNLQETLTESTWDDLNTAIAQIKAFMLDADATDTTINKWKEVESFLTGVTDTETLSGLLNDLKTNITNAYTAADTALGTRIGNVEGQVTTLQGEMTTVKGTLTNVQQSVTSLQNAQITATDYSGDTKEYTDLA